MTTYYVGIGGNNSNSGLFWALRRLTLTSIETLVAAGDRVLIGPGTYRETLTCTANGSAYTTGTASVTNGSAIVTGSGTSWLANAFADDIFQACILASGTDGVTNGTTTFTSAAGNFQQGHIGLTIRINTKDVYTIAAVASLTSITLSGVPAAPTAGSGLTYEVGPESPYEIQSVDSNTQLTLKLPWSGPSLSGLAYSCWKSIAYIGDEMGTLTDGVGGQIRITGSDNDQTQTRATGVVSLKSYRVWRGLHIDTTTIGISLGSGATGAIVDRCAFTAVVNGVDDSTATIAREITVKRSVFMMGIANSIGVRLYNSAAFDNTRSLIENCLFVAVGAALEAINPRQSGGTLIRNVLIIGASVGIAQQTSPNAGQGNTVNNSIITGCNVALLSVVASTINENYNDLFGNNTNRSTVNTGANSVSYTPLFSLPLLTLGLNTWLFELLSSLSPLVAIAGLYPPADDLFGTLRVNPSSWGPVQYVAGRRPVDSGPSRGRIS